MHFLPCSKENPTSSVLRENALFPFRLSNYLDKRQRQYCLLQKRVFRSGYSSPKEKFLRSLKIFTEVCTRQLKQNKNKTKLNSQNAIRNYHLGLKIPQIKFMARVFSRSHRGVTSYK